MERRSADRRLWGLRLVFGLKLKAADLENAGPRYGLRNTMKKTTGQKGFWTKPRKDIPLIRIYALLAVAIVAALTKGGPFTMLLLGAVGLGILIAVFLHYRSD